MSKTIPEMKRSKKRMCFFLFTCPRYTYTPDKDSYAHDILESLLDTPYVSCKDSTYTLTKAGVIEIPFLINEMLNYGKALTPPKEDLTLLPASVKAYIKRLEARSNLLIILKNVTHDFLIGKYQEESDGMGT